MRTRVMVTDDETNQREFIVTQKYQDPGHDYLVRELITTVLESRWYHWLILGILAVGIWKGMFWHAAKAERDYRQFQVEIEAQAMDNHR